MSALSRLFGTRAATALVALGTTAMSIAPGFIREARGEQAGGVAAKPAAASMIINPSEHERIAREVTREDGSKNSWEIVRMRHPISTQRMDPFIEVMNNPEKFVIVNYSQIGGSPDSEKQLKWLEQMVPKLATVSKRPVVLVDVSALYLNLEGGKPEPAFLATVLADLEQNKMGKNRTTVPFNPSKGALLPYVTYNFDGKKFSDDSLALYPKAGTDAIKRKVFIEGLVEASDAADASPAVTSSLTLGR